MISMFLFNTAPSLGLLLRTEDYPYGVTNRNVLLLITSA